MQLHAAWLLLVAVLAVACSGSRLRAPAGGRGDLGLVVRGHAAGHTEQGGATVGGGVAIDSNVGTVGDAGSAGAGANDVAAAVSALRQQLVSLVDGFLVEGKVPFRNITLLAKKKMDLQEAKKALEGKLPPDVAALLKLAENSWGSKEDPSLSEESLSKARVILNGMVEKAYSDVDKTTIDCVSFKDRNRKTFGQASNDIARIAGQISDLRRKEIGAMGSIDEQSRMHAEVQGMREKTQLECAHAHKDKSADLKEKEADLAVFNFLLDATKCSDGAAAAAFSQIPQKHSNVSICALPHGGLELRFVDPKAQARLQEMMTTPAHKVLDQLLGKFDTQKDGLLQLRANVSAAEEPAPVQSGPNQYGQWKKCAWGKPDCGVLHDTMSLQWGVYRDLVDELKHGMSMDAAQCKGMQDNLNEQLAVVSDTKVKAQEMLSETTAGMQAQTAEQTAKTEEYHELEITFRKKMAECSAKLTELVFTNVCAVKKVREELMKLSKETPPEKISDCDVDDWTPGQCSVECDDACPHPDPEKCGGFLTLERRVVTQPNEYGIACPVLTNQLKCNQVKCPVNCVLSEWSSFSACSAECGGGAQGRTRSMLAKPKNGGQACDTTMESRPCNTGSCDRDCTLHEWSAWSPCSVACGGGIQERVRTVDVPIRGEGKCPTPDHADRLEEQSCNTQECVGDEVCVAKQDLIIAIDGSGSLREKGFDTLRDFAANVSGRYLSTHLGEEAMQVGVILFGQGALEEDGTVTAAQMVQALTGNIPSVAPAIEGLTWQKGTTNMAQALALAERMFREGGRPGAQSALMILTDGKPSLKFVTGQQIELLKDKGTQIYMAPISEIPNKDCELLKTWASQPWETNYERIPGLQALQGNFDGFAGQLIARFCPNAISPSHQKQMEDEKGFMVIHIHGQPSGASQFIGEFPSASECAAASVEAGLAMFVYHADGAHVGSCFGSTAEVSAEQWDEWSQDSTSVDCPDGEWEYNPYASTYVNKPSVLEEAMSFQGAFIDAHHYYDEHD